MKMFNNLFLLLTLSFVLSNYVLTMEERNEDNPFARKVPAKKVLRLQKGYSTLSTMPLLKACKEGSIQDVESILAKGININQQYCSYRKCYTLHETALMIAAQSGYAAIVKLLLLHNAFVNSKDAKGNTALMFAAINGHMETLNLLLEYGAMLNMQNISGGTAFIMAASKAQAQVIKRLLQTHLVNINAKDSHGYTALMLAKKSDHPKAPKIIKKLIRAGASDS